MVKMLIEQPCIIEGMCNNIMAQKKIGTYDEAYKAVKIATGTISGRDL